MKLVILIAVSITLSSCALLRNSHVGCALSGGEIRNTIGGRGCIPKYRDGGKACNSSEQCKGYCLTLGNSQVGDVAQGECQKLKSNDSICKSVENGIVKEIYMCYEE